jgi:hypothetical protein
VLDHRRRRFHPIGRGHDEDRPVGHPVGEADQPALRSQGEDLRAGLSTGEVQVARLGDVVAEDEALLLPGDVDPGSRVEDHEVWRDEHMLERARPRREGKLRLDEQLRYLPVSRQVAKDPASAGEPERAHGRRRPGDLLAEVPDCH